jgi:hypothetical protein
MFKIQNKLGFGKLADLIFFNSYVVIEDFSADFFIRDQLAV